MQHRPDRRSRSGSAASCGSTSPRWSPPRSGRPRRRPPASSATPRPTSRDPPDRPGRLARHRLARGVRRPGPLDGRPADLLRRGRRRRRADPATSRSTPSGPTIMRYGTDEQKQRHPARRSSRASCTSRSATPSPGSGTDLATLQTRARRDGDEWVINGQKMWTCLIQYADYVWLACRTDPDLPRHKGLSMILVPTDAAGLLLHAGPHGGRRLHLRDLLRGRPGPGRTTSSASSTAAGR